MRDVFISYAREDSDFIRSLSEKLEEHKLEAWVDLEGVYAGEEFWSTICSGIEDSNAFLFVITPNSVASEYCRREIDHALLHNKRILPILRSDVNTELLHSAVASRQWMFIRENDEFETGIRNLTEAIGTDINWVRAHTRLVTRAVEWDSKKRDNSFLLQGSDLQEAEEWLAQSGDKEPRPTEMQTQYILASRKAATKRQRITLGAVTFALVVAIFLAVFAFLQRNLAIRQAKIALARQLAIQAELIRGNSSESLQRSLLLAIESYRLQPTDMGIQVLRRGLSLVPRFITHLRNEESVSDFAFSPNSLYLATADRVGNIIVWGVNSGREIVRMKHENQVNDLTFSPKGDYLATASSDHTARIWEVKNGKELTRMTHNSKVLAVAFSPDGKYLATLSEKNLKVSEVSNFLNILNLDYEGGNFGNKEVLAFSPDGEFLAIASGNISKVVGIRSKNQVVQVSHDTTIWSLTFSPDGRYLATASYDHTARVWDVNSGYEVARMIHKSLVNGLAFSPDGKYLATVSTDKTARVWDISNSKELLRLSHEDSVTDVTFSPDGQYVATSSFDRTARVWIVSNGQEVTRLADASYVDGVLFDSNGKRIATLTGSQYVRIWEIPSAEEVESVELEDKANLVVISKNNEYLAIAGGYTTQVWNISSGLKIANMDHENKVKTLAFSLDDNYLITGSGSSLMAWEIRSGQRVAFLDQKDEVMAIAFSSDGNYRHTILRHSGNAIILSKNEIKKNSYKLHEQIRESKIGPIILNHSMEEKGNKAVAFSKNGKYVATANVLNIIQVWEIGTKREIGRISNESLVESLALNNNGAYMAVLSGGKIRIWEVRSGQELLRIEQKVVIQDVDFSFDEKYLVTVDIDNIARLWQLWPEDLITEACSRLIRNLTLDEWRQYLGDEPYLKTCSNLV